jgi:hypothetical protein
MTPDEQREIEQLRTEINERRKRIATIQSRARMRRSRKTKQSNTQTDCRLAT